MEPKKKEIHNKIFLDIQQNVQKSWFKFLFQHTALAKLLHQESPPPPLVFYITYRSSWWFTRLWFRSCIQNQENRKQFHEILDMLSTLKSSYQYDCQDIFNHTNSEALISIFGDLANAALIDGIQYWALIDDRHNEQRMEVFSFLYLNNLFTRENIVIVKNIASRMFSSALSSLNQNKFLNQTTFDILTKNHLLLFPYPWEWNLVLQLNNLKDFLVSHKDNLALVAQHEKPSQLIPLLHCFYLKRILTQKNFEIITQKTDTSKLALVLKYLSQYHHVTPEYLLAILQHNNLDSLALGLDYLQKDGILTPQNRDFITIQQNPSDWASALVKVKKSNINCFVQGTSIVTKTYDDYSKAKEYFPKSFRHMFMPTKEYYLEREKYLNRVIAHWLQHIGTFSLLNVDTITHILDYLVEFPIYRWKAMGFLCQEDYPKDLTLYRNDLKERMNRAISLWEIR